MLEGHLSPAETAASAKQAKRSPDDVVIVSAVRTPLTKAKKGGFKDTHHEVMLKTVLQAVVEKVRHPGSRTLCG